MVETVARYARQELKKVIRFADDWHRGPRFGLHDPRGMGTGRNAGAGGDGDLLQRLSEDAQGFIRLWPRMQSGDGFQAGVLDLRVLEQLHDSSNHLWALDRLIAGGRRSSSS